MVWSFMLDGTLCRGGAWICVRTYLCRAGRASSKCIRARKTVLDQWHAQRQVWQNSAPFERSRVRPCCLSAKKAAGRSFEADGRSAMSDRSRARYSGHGGGLLGMSTGVMAAVATMVVRIAAASVVGPSRGFPVTGDRAVPRLYSRAKSVGCLDQLEQRRLAERRHHVAVHPWRGLLLPKRDPAAGS